MNTKAYLTASMACIAFSLATSAFGQQLATPGFLTKASVTSDLAQVAVAPDAGTIADLQAPGRIVDFSRPVAILKSKTTEAAIDKERRDLYQLRDAIAGYGYFFPDFAEYDDLRYFGHFDAVGDDALRTRISSALDDQKLPDYGAAFKAAYADGASLQQIISRFAFLDEIGRSAGDPLIRRLTLDIIRERARAGLDDITSSILHLEKAEFPPNSDLLIDRGASIGKTNGSALIRLDGPRGDTNPRGPCVYLERYWKAVEDSGLQDERDIRFALILSPSDDPNTPHWNLDRAKIPKIAGTIQTSCDAVIVEGAAIEKKRALQLRLADGAAWSPGDAINIRPSLESQISNPFPDDTKAIDFVANAATKTPVRSTAALDLVIDQLNPSVVIASGKVEYHEGARPSFDDNFASLSPAQALDPGPDNKYQHFYTEIEFHHEVTAARYLVGAYDWKDHVDALENISLDDKESEVQRVQVSTGLDKMFAEEAVRVRNDLNSYNDGAIAPPVRSFVINTFVGDGTIEPGAAIARIHPLYQYRVRFTPPPSIDHAFAGAPVRISVVSPSGSIGGAKAIFGGMPKPISDNAQAALVSAIYQTKLDGRIIHVDGATHEWTVEIGVPEQAFWVAGTKLAQAVRDELDRAAVPHRDNMYRLPAQYLQPDGSAMVRVEPVGWSF